MASRPPDRPPFETPPSSPKPLQQPLDHLRESLLENDELTGVFYDIPLGIGSTCQSAERNIPDWDELSRHRLVIAIDYGTTFTGQLEYSTAYRKFILLVSKGVAYATPRFDDAKLDEIKIVSDWGAGMGSDDKIPSIYSYSPAPEGQRQWGADITEDAVTMVNTKMELRTQDDKMDELELLLQVLNRTCNLDFETIKAQRCHSRYLVKSPNEIVTDFLSKVFRHLYDHHDHLGPLLRSLMPVDIVIAVPVVS